MAACAHTHMSDIRYRKWQQVQSQLRGSLVSEDGPELQTWCFTSDETPPDVEPLWSPSTPCYSACKRWFKNKSSPLETHQWPHTLNQKLSGGFLLRNQVESAKKEPPWRRSDITRWITWLMVLEDWHNYDSNHGDVFFQIVTVVTLKLAVAADRPPKNQWHSKSRSSPSAALKKPQKRSKGEKAAASL